MSEEGVPCILKSIRKGLVRRIGNCVSKSTIRVEAYMLTEPIE